MNDIEKMKFAMKQIKNIYMQSRILNKQIENANKPPLISPDASLTESYTFSKFSINEIGDSGELLLATNKKDDCEQYVVKHQYTHCACNEFVYAKIAQYINLKMPKMMLFKICDNDQSLFQTEYVLGIKYLDICDRDPSIETIMNTINWCDFFRNCAMFIIFKECDSFENVISKNNYLYRIDTSESFALDDTITYRLGARIEGENVKEFDYQEFLPEINHNINSYKLGLDKMKNNYGDEAAKHFLDTFRLVQQVPDGYITDFLHTLCYFYPDIIGNYYSLYFKKLKDAIEVFLTSL